MSTVCTADRETKQYIRGTKIVKNFLVNPADESLEVCVLDEALDEG